jgi:transposase-like protein
VLMMKCASCRENTILDKETERLVSYKCQACESSNTELKKSNTS